MPKILNLVGLQSGHITVVAKTDMVMCGRRMWKALCSCGRERLVNGEVAKMGRGCRYCAHKGPRPNRRLRPFEATYNVFKSRARYKVTLSYEDFLKLTNIRNCHYCDAPIEWKEYRHRGTGGNGSNLDRKDNAGIYSCENVVVCCGRCNYAKGSHFSYEEWVQIGKTIKNLPKRDYIITPMSSKRHGTGRKYNI